jgi:hypothetical protein
MYSLIFFNVELDLLVWSGLIAIPLLCSWAVTVFAKRKKMYIELWGLHFNFLVSILSVLLFWLRDNS